MNPFYHRIYRVVRHIPKGRVATYGVVARLASRPGPPDVERHACSNRHGPQAVDAGHIGHVDGDQPHAILHHLQEIPAVSLVASPLFAHENDDVKPAGIFFFNYGLLAQHYLMSFAAK